MKKLILLVIQIIISGNLFCQVPIWINYNSSNSGLPDNWVPVIEIDNNNNKWIGTVYGGLAKFDNDQWQIFNTSNSGLAAHNIQALHIDLSDTKWIGSGWTGKISKFDNTNWTVYDSANTNGIIFELVGTNDIITDKSGNLLVGTSGMGIYSYGGINWSNLNSISGLFIYDFSLDNNQDLWIGQWNDGATFFDGVNVTNYNSSNSILPSDDVTSIAVETSGVVWITTRYDGIVKFDGNNWFLYNNLNTNLPSNSFNSVIIDQDNVKWFATGNGGTGFGSGIVKFDDINWVTYDTSNSDIPSNDVICFAVDANNNLWMGTQANGVGVFNPNGIFLSVNDNFINKPIINTYPNPFIINVEFQFNENSNLDYELTISNPLGKAIIVRKINTSQQIIKLNLGYLSPGLYFATFKNNKGQILTEKLMKQ